MRFVLYQRAFTVFLTSLQAFLAVAAARSSLYYDALNAVMEGRDLYAELGLDPDSEVALVKRAYRDLAVKHHPDKVKDARKRAEAGRKYARITEAYRILSDEEARAEYHELRITGANRVSYTDRYYHRHTHKYGIPPHNPFKVFVALVLILSALKFGGQYLTYKYYLRMAMAHPRYKQWAKAQGDTTGERLKLVGVKPPSWDSIFAVQILLLPYYLYRFLRWLVLHVILRRPYDQVEMIAKYYDLTEEEIAKLRAQLKAHEERQKREQEEGGAGGASEARGHAHRHAHKRR